MTIIGHGIGHQERRIQAGVRRDRDFEAIPQEWSEERYSAKQRQLHRVTFTGLGVSRTDIYGYNARSELVLAAKNAEDAKEHEYAYDPIGNRQTSSDLGTTRAYTANSLNQYTEISTLRASAPPRETFIPLFDDDGNQDLNPNKDGRSVL